MTALIATIITSSRQHIIGDAIRSVIEWVDAIQILDLGIEDDTMKIACEIAHAHDKPVYTTMYGIEWNNDTAAARNAVLEAANASGGDWALMLDTDERMHAPTSDIHAVLAEATEPYLLCEGNDHMGGFYTKEKYFRLPLQGKYVGAVHECFAPAAPTRCVGSFTELEKSPEMMRARLESDAVSLAGQTMLDPDNARTWYYLAETYVAIGWDEMAGPAFNRCIELNVDDELSAVSYFKLGLIAGRSNHWHAALHACVLGMGHRPAFPELAWLAAGASLNLGMPSRAIEWSNIALLSNISTRPQIRKSERISPAPLTAYYEAPLAVMRDAFKVIGDDEVAKYINAQYEMALQMRLANERK